MAKTDDKTTTTTTDDKAAEDKAAAEKAAAEKKAAALAIARVECAKSGHAWSLPSVNPFNDPSLTVSDIACKRCEASGTMTITQKS